MKKYFSLLLALSMAICMLAGCSSGEAEPQPEQQNQSAAPSANEPPSDGASVPTESGEPVYINADAAEMTGTVRFFTAFAGESGTDALIAEFNEYYPNINVEINVYKNGGEGNVGLDTAMIAGEADVIMSYGVANTAQRWANGMLTDLTDRLAADNLDLVKEWGTDSYLYNDRAYVFPSGGISLYVAVNMDKWEAAGLGEIPDAWTWEEYLEACRAMTERDASGAVTVYGGSDANISDYWTYSIRQTKEKNAFYKEDGTSDFDNPLWAMALQRELDAEAEGIWYSKANYLADSTKSRDKILTGEIASTVEAVLTRYITATEHDFKIAYAPYPVNQEGETNYMGGSIPNSFVAVASTSQNQDAAYAFAKFCATYGNKYMYAAGHATTWTGVEADEVLDVVFGSKEEAEKWIDSESFVKNVIATGEPAYTEDYIVGFTEIQNLIFEYSYAVFDGEITPAEAMAEMKPLADQAIQEAS